LKIKLIAIASLLLVCWLSGGCASSRDFDARLSSIVKPYRFSIAKWESVAIPREVNQWIFSRYKKSDDEIGVVAEYFSSIERIKTLKSEIQAINAGTRQGDSVPLEAELNRLQEQRVALENTVEKIIEGQIKETLAKQGIFNPIDRHIRLKIFFPPVNFELEKPPHWLVISPRDRIERMRTITLQPGISLTEIEGIEARVDKLGVSSLVVELGGLSTYPSIITDEANLRYVIDSATDEWVHHYLVFTPLGFQGLLDIIGVSPNYEIYTMNQTIARMVSKEIGAIVYEKYYAQYENDVNQNQTTESEFDFNREMREIRKTVDTYLARGEIEQAEEFMEQKRQYLASMGHYIRKLNQAYFAFHGAYADRPAFISPIGLELKELRSQSASVKDFLNTVAAMTSRQELRDSIR